MFLEATSEIASRITSAIRNAARATGASFEYLLKTALRESNLDPAARASTSSAAGLFQFIDQTWLETIKNADPALGYGRYADAIVQTASGRYVVPDPVLRQEILNLRNDPAAASAMAAAFTQRNAEVLTARLGRRPTDGELYIAHFLGAAGAGQLITTAFAAPHTKAADLFPEAARANRSIFYDRAGGARSAAEVYALLVGRHDRTRPAPPEGAEVATAGAPAPMGPILPLPAAFAVSSAGNGRAPATALAFAPDDGPVFHNLFQTGRRGPVSLVVSELWGARNAPSPAPAKPAPAAGDAHAGAAPARPLNLFQFLRPEIRGDANRSV
ncbi:MAG: lytic transglycosylase domain-containing protein [Variibacter sp.]|nr:lytic transglycosylase domain-containing protein [Variibacter sp.]